MDFPEQSSYSSGFGIVFFLLLLWSDDADEDEGGALARCPAGGALAWLASTTSLGATEAFPFLLYPELLL